MSNQNQTDASSRPALARALRGESTSRVPLWYMRQAGRYLPEYHEVRNRFSFMDLCRDVESAVRVSLQPHERFSLDGVIMFSDILTPLSGAGIELHFEEKRGPVIDTLITEMEHIDIMADFQPERDTAFVAEILRTLRATLEERAAKDGVERPGLLGFAGAPFTLTSYLIEGGTSRHFDKTKAAIFGRSDFYHALANRLTEITINYLKMQAAAGADVVQIFDSWGGVLSPADYREFAMPYTARIIKALRESTDIPVILFVGNSAHLVPEMVEQEPTALGMDWRVTAEQIERLVPGHMAVQGNLDPLTLYGSPDRVRCGRGSVRSTPRATWWE